MSALLFRLRRFFDKREHDRIFRAVDSFRHGLGAPIAPKPEYDIVDLERNRRAIADPSGFRRNLNSSPAKEAPWGLVKELYR